VNLRLLAEPFEVWQITLWILVQLPLLPDRGFRLINPEPYASK
jgi:hypothetical protein